MSTELPFPKFDQEKGSGPAPWAISAWWPLLLVALPLGCADFAVAPLMDNIRPQDAAAMFVYACFGIIPAQVALLSIGLVFVDGPFWQRLLVHSFCAGLLISLWFAGFVIAGWQGHEVPNHVLEEAARGVCALPLISLATQLPLWLVRMFGWRLVPISTRDEFAAPQPEAKLTIADLLIATAIVAATFAIARAAPLPEHQRANPQSFWIAVGLFAASSSGVSLVGILPLLWFFARLSLPMAWMLAIVYSLAYWLFFIVLGASGLFVGMRLDSMQVLGLMVFLIAFACGVAGGLTALKIKGVIFATGRQYER